MSCISGIGPHRRPCTATPLTARRKEDGSGGQNGPLASDTAGRCRGEGGQLHHSIASPSFPPSRSLTFPFWRHDGCDSPSQCRRGTRSTCRRLRYWEGEAQISKEVVGGWEEAERGSRKTLISCIVHSFWTFLWGFQGGVVQCHIRWVCWVSAFFAFNAISLSTLRCRCILAWALIFVFDVYGASVTGTFCLGLRLPLVTCDQRRRLLAE